MLHDNFKVNFRDNTKNIFFSLLCALRGRVEREKKSFYQKLNQKEKITAIHKS